MKHFFLTFLIIKYLYEAPLLEILLPTVYFLRHEDRPLQTSTFYIELTEKGHIGAQKLVSKLNPLNIDYIYSSPFIRTLQTIKPYTLQNNVQVRTDY